MFKFSLRTLCGWILGAGMAALLATACYDDTELRESITRLRSQLAQMEALVSSLQNDDAVTGVTTNADGSISIQFKKSGTITIHNGKDGEPGAPGKDGKDGSIVSVVKDEDTYTFLFDDGTRLVLPRYSEIRVLTFEDADYKGKSGVSAYWTSLVDDPQYGGPLLYSPDGYAWSDDDNTFLGATVLPQDFEAFTYGFSSGGIAISNYGSSAMDNADYTRQLECFGPALAPGSRRSGAGHGGSDNFAVVYDAQMGHPAALVMQDGVARIVKSAYVANMTYTLNTLINGDAFTAPMANNGFLKITATGYVGEEESGTSEFYLAKTVLNFVTEWKEWDLSELGAVDRIVFSVSGSEDLYNDYGLNVPAYFAIDDIAVKVHLD